MATVAPIVIAPCGDCWPDEFEAAREVLGRALGEVAVCIDHIGSTSAPGLAATNIIDIQISVADLDDPRMVSGL